MSTGKLVAKCIATLCNNAEGIKFKHSSEVIVSRNALLNGNGGVPRGLVERHKNYHEYCKICNNMTHLLQ
jgi:hypothetical protein